MKKVVFLSLILFSVVLNSCVTTQKVPGSTKGDNKIVIKTNQAYDTAYRQMGQILSENGYGIENSDKDLGTITTGSVKLSKLDGSMKINISFKENENTEIVLNGLVKMNADIDVGYGVTSKSNWDKVENKGMSGSMMQIAWNDLYDLAQQHPDGEISFR